MLAVRRQVMAKFDLETLEQFIVRAERNSSKLHSVF